MLNNQTTAIPGRVQRRRTAGWRMPANTVYVGRGSRWGNPIKVGSHDPRSGGVFGASDACERFCERLVLGKLPFSEADAGHELRGKNLACWCAPTAPCHADILLEIANA